MEMDSIEKGIVETIYQHRIRKFVMGAAADKHYSMYLALDMTNSFIFGSSCVLFYNRKFC